MNTYYVVDLYDFSKYKDPAARAAKYLREQSGTDRRLCYKKDEIDDYHYLYIDKNSWYRKAYYANTAVLQDKMLYGHQIIMFSPTKRRRLL